MVALCPEQFKSVLGGKHDDGYCSKLGYARPLGWGSVCIEANHLLWLENGEDAKPLLKSESDLKAWVQEHYKKTDMQREWLDIHRRNHPDADDYPRMQARDRSENIFTYHTTLRAEHSRARRYKNERSS